MKILFACCNIGFGHLSRSLVLADELRKHKNIEVAFAIGRPYNEYLEKNTDYKVFKLYRSIPLASSAGLDFTGTLTFARDLIRNFMIYPARIVKIIECYKPDLILSDSELLVPLISKIHLKKYRKPAIMITHQPKLFTKYRKVDHLWRLYLSKAFKLIIVPDIVGVDAPVEIKDKIIRVGALANSIKLKKRATQKKLGLRKSVCIIPSFASTGTADKIQFLESVKRIALLYPDYDFAILGQSETRTIGNVKLREMSSTNPLEYMVASDVIVLSGYTALMEAVMIRRPVLMIPTQAEQRKIARLGENDGILMAGTIDDLPRMLENEKQLEVMVKNQKKIHSGVKESADAIFSVYRSFIQSRGINNSV
ncbi:MAG: hypothetical protein ABIA21_02305 [Candidatus Aenigmatarchaeota archaeon]